MPLTATERRITHVARQLGSKPETGIADFDGAWRLLRRDRPDYKPEDCMFSRQLINAFLDQLEAYLEQRRG